MSIAKTALDGLRVIDFSHYIAGPFCTMMLADLGADVIKVEKADGGDDLRRFAPFVGDTGAAFLWANRNKRSIALDLRLPQARQIALELVARADVLVENFAEGVMERFGLGHEALRQRHPRLIYCTVSAFRRGGPNAKRVALDPVIQAESGFMSTNGHADLDGVRTGASIMDVSSAIMACNAVLAAVIARDRHGEGQHVEVPLFEQGITMLGMQAMACLVTGEEPKRMGNASPDASPSGVFKALDGPFYMTCPGDKPFAALCDLIGRPELALHADYATRAARRLHRDALHRLIGERFLAGTRQAWVDKLQSAGVPAGVVRSVGDALSCEEATAGGMVGTVHHGRLGPVPNIGLPLHLSATPLMPATAAPDLGQHTGEVVQGMLGHASRQVDAWRRDGVFGSTGA